MNKITKGTALRIKPEWQDTGDDEIKWEALEDEYGGRIRIVALNTGLRIAPNQVVTVDMVEVIPS